MTEENMAIPQIKPEEESILVPKTAQPVNPVNQDAQVRMPLQIKKKFLPKRLFIVLAVVLSLFLVLGIQGLLVYSKAKSFITAAKDLKNSLSSQDITKIKTQITNSQKSLKGFKSSLKMLFWIKPIPFIGSFVKDLDHGLTAAGYAFEAGQTTITASEPYLDILGFGKGDKEGDGAKTTQERIDFVAKAIPDLIPKMDSISRKMTAAKEELVFINPDRYPIKLAGKEIREPLKKALELFDQAATFVSQGKPLLEAAPYLLGLDGTRKYLILFQNDTELRPTGGFLTGYAQMNVEKAKFDQVSSNDIYNLDAKYKATIPAPEPFIKYVKLPYGASKAIRLRDMNWSPDFYESMKTFLTEAQKAGLPEVDGIIAVDTQALVYILDAIGPIGVPGFGNFSTQIEPKCNCPQVIYELEKFADVEGPIVWFMGKIVFQPANADNRKKIIGPLMNSLFANALGQPKEKLPSLFEAGFKSLLEKHILFYLIDPKAQAGVEAFGIAGRIKDYNGDYLHINDANMAGRKSNLYVTQEVEQKIEVEKGDIVKTITLTYKNPAKQDGWLNTVLPNWVRVYVPKGSILVSAEGLEEKQDPYEDLGKTVFAGFFKLRPEGVAKITFKYKLPFKAQKELKILIQKQPGTKSPLYSIETSREKKEFSLTTDKELKIKI